MKCEGGRGILADFRGRGFVLGGVVEEQRVHQL